MIGAGTTTMHILNMNIGKAVGGTLPIPGTSRGVSEEVCHTIHALYGLSCPTTDQATWECVEVFWTG